MKAELFRGINGCFLLNKLGDPTLLVHSFKENTTLLDISKFEEFVITPFPSIPIDSLLQSDFRHFTGSMQTLGLPIFILSFLWQLLRRFTLTLFCITRVMLILITLFK